MINEGTSDYYKGALTGVLETLAMPVMSSQQGCNLALKYARQGGALGVNVTAMKQEAARLEDALLTLREAIACAQKDAF